MGYRQSYGEGIAFDRYNQAAIEVSRTARTHIQYGPSNQRNNVPLGEHLNWKLDAVQYGAEDATMPV